MHLLEVSPDSSNTDADHVEAGINIAFEQEPFSI